MYDKKGKEHKNKKTRESEKEKDSQVRNEKV